MFVHFQSKVIRHLALLLGCTLLPACTNLEIKQSERTQSSDAPRLISIKSPQPQRIDLYTKLSSKFLAKIKLVPDPDSRMYYTQGIHELYRLAQRDPTNREILEKLVQHQDQTLDIFQICGDKEKFSKSFDWQTLYHSLFWKQVDNSYLVLLICGTGTSNRGFVPFLYSENNGEAKLKPLKLTRFFKESDGTVQRFESGVGVGRTFPNSDQWFDPVTKELRIWTRLLGGASPCGTKGTYPLQNNEFVLQEFAARFECDPTKQGDYEKLYP